MFLRALRVTEIFKCLRAKSPAGKIFVSWAHYERANEKCLKFDSFLAVTQEKDTIPKHEALREGILCMLIAFFISRVAASKNHTFFNHFLCLTITHYRESSHIFFTQCPFLTSCSIFEHIWPSGRVMQMLGENIDKTAFTFGAR